MSLVNYFSSRINILGTKHKCSIILLGVVANTQTQTQLTALPLPEVHPYIGTQMLETSGGQILKLVSPSSGTMVLVHTDGGFPPPPSFTGGDETPPYS